jgi:hypothetical protein
MCRFWDSPADLGSQVSRSLVKLIKTHPAIGWVRGDLVPDQSTIEEILQLKKQIESLKAELENVRTQAPEGTSSLAQGNDTFALEFSFVASPDQWAHNGSTYSSKIEATWDDIFASVSPLMINEASDDQFKSALNRLVSELADSSLSHSPLGFERVDHSG